MVSSRISANRVSLRTEMHVMVVTATATVESTKIMCPRPPNAVWAYARPRVKRPAWTVALLTPAHQAKPQTTISATVKTTTVMVRPMNTMSRAHFSAGQASARSRDNGAAWTGNSRRVVNQVNRPTLISATAKTTTVMG